ncbi:MAG: hypothetical protein KDD60_06645 [Bdellovibrionales bacterium]|nr:hypothetical protein [Bdellovibrionales bacterium]
MRYTKFFIVFSSLILFSCQFALAEGPADLLTQDLLFKDALRPPGVIPAPPKEKPATILSENEQYQIEVLFLYSPEVEELVGSTANLEARIVEFVDIANETFENSGLQVRVKSVGLEPSPVSEQDDAPAELALIAQNETVKALREQYSADIVSSLVSHTSKGLHCGNGYLLVALDDNAQNWGQNVVSLHSVCEKWVFTHELGHNLGADHDEGNHDPSTMFSYARGYRASVFGSYTRTVMAFAPGTVVHYFSSPNLSHEDIPLGTENADNTRALEQTIGFVAAYRGDSTAPIEPTLALQVSHTKRTCTLQVTANNLPENSPSVELRLHRKSGSFRVLKELQISGDSLQIRLKRSKKSKSYSVASGDTASEQVVCKKISFKKRAAQSRLITK